MGFRLGLTRRHDQLHYHSHVLTGGEIALHVGSDEDNAHKEHCFGDVLRLCSRERAGEIINHSVTTQYDNVHDDTDA